MGVCERAHACTYTGSGMLVLTRRARAGAGARGARRNTHGWGRHAGPRREHSRAELPVRPGAPREQRAILGHRQGVRSPQRDRHPECPACAPGSRSHSQEPGFQLSKFNFEPGFFAFFLFPTNYLCSPQRCGLSGRGLEWDRRREIAGAWRDGLAHGGIVLSARRPGALGRARVSLSGRPLPAVHTRRRAAENAIICPQRPRHTPPKNGRACAQPGARAGRSAGALSQGAACVWARRHRRAGAVRRPGRATQPYSPHCSPPPL